jgi:folate-binding protein YgfZ
MYDVLTTRAMIKISGSDRLAFLQNILTNDVQLIETSGIVYSLLLNPQGRFLYDMFVVSLEDNGVYLDHDARFTQELISKLNFYKVGAEVDVLDVSQEYVVMFLDQSPPLKVEDMGVFCDPRHTNLGFRAYLKKEDMQRFLTAVDMSESKGIYLDRIYELCVSEPHRDMVQDRSIPLEYGLDNYNAISFSKGCYIGQELISRVKHTGVIRKGLYQFRSAIDMSYLSAGAEVITDTGHSAVFCSQYKNIVRVLAYK